MQLNINREYIRKLKSSDKDIKIFKILFNLNNRVRVLEGKQEITKRQFIVMLKSL